MKPKSLSEFFHSCKNKSTSLYQDFITILTEKRNKNHTNLISGVDLLEEEDQKLLLEWMEKKEDDYPLQYFINQVEFCGINFHVEEGALIPRMETEEIVLFAVGEIKKENLEVQKILDIGSGTGCMGLSARALLQDEVNKTTLVEPSKEALKSLNANVKALGVEGVEVKASSFEELELTERYDLILSNPPYIPPDDPDVENSVYKYEPHKALFGGLDPVKLIVLWVNKAYDLLEEKGLMIFEFSHNQKNSLEIALSHLSPIFYKDSFNKDRFFVIRKKGK